MIGIEADEFRVLNDQDDQGRPHLYYSSRLFNIIDSHKPDDWMTERGEEGERYAYPLPLNAVGFFEDFFDDKPKAVATFWPNVLLPRLEKDNARHPARHRFEVYAKRRGQHWPI